MPSVWNRTLSRALSVVLASALILGGTLVAGPAMAAESGTGTISGSVVDADGVALAGVDVWAYPQGDGQSVMASTSADGSFSISAVPEGDYALVFRLRIDGTELSEWWNNASSEETATPVTVTADGVVDDIDIMLAESDGSTLEDYTAAVSGVVTGADGQPLAGVSVSMQLADRPAGQTVWTNTSGQWSFGSVGAGRYIFSFRTVIDGQDIVEYWDDAAAVTDATVITLTRGEERTDLVTVLELPTPPELESSVPTIVGTPRVGATLTAATGAWTDGASFIHQWAVDGALVAGATASAFVVPAASVGKTITVAVTGAKDGFSPVTRISAPTTAVQLGVLTTAVPTISGKAAVGSTLTAVPGTWTPGTAFTYKWFASGAAIAGATQASFPIAPAQHGKVITVAVTGAKTGYTSRAVTSAGTSPVAAGTLTAATPTISGTGAVGSTLTASPGKWATGSTFTYQWLANGTTLTGATSSKLVLTTAHKDKQISVRVTGRLTGYTTTSKTSASTPKIATVSTPKITGIARVNAKLTAVPGTWTSSTVFAYQWYADGAPITGATSSTFVPKSAQQGKKITVKVTGTRSGYTTAARTSASTLKVTAYSTPTVTGMAAVGYTLTAVRGSWSTGMSFSYQWYADGAAISGATASTFKVTSTQRDKRLTVKVTGKQSGFTTVAATSASSSRVSTVATPSISGVFMVGSTLTAKPNTWTTGTSFTYQWLDDGVAISGATRSTLVLGTAQSGKQITVTVTGKKSGWSTVARTSGKTARIAVTAVPSISGRLIAGSKLSARTGTWTGGTAFAYQWYVNGAAVSGATGSTFTLSRSHIGKAIRVTVVGKQSGYQTISRSSATTSAVTSGKAAPATRDNCPSAYPIKGNQTTQHTTDWIFHVPSGRYYAITDPEECFATETAAVAWGYRKSLS